MKEIPLFPSFEKQPESKSGLKTRDEPPVYEFKVAQSLSKQWTAWFDGLEITCDDQGNTLLTGVIMDQAALHGVIAKIRGLNLILLSIIRK